MKDAASAVGAQVEWRDSKPYLAIAKKQSLFIGLATKATEYFFSANTVNQARKDYNAYNCQGVIAINTSIGGAPSCGFPAMVILGPTEPDIAPMPMKTGRFRTMAA